MNKPYPEFSLEMVGMQVLMQSQFTTAGRWCSSKLFSSYRNGSCRWQAATEVLGLQVPVGNQSIHCNRPRSTIINLALNGNPRQDLAADKDRSRCAASSHLGIAFQATRAAQRAAVGVVSQPRTMCSFKVRDDTADWIYDEQVAKASELRRHVLNCILLLGFQLPCSDPNACVDVVTASHQSCLRTASPTSLLWQRSASQTYPMHSLFQMGSMLTYQVATALCLRTKQ